MDKNTEFTKYLKFQKSIIETYGNVMEAAAKKCGISRQEADVLVFFYNNPECTLATDAVKYRGFSKAYVSKALEQLSDRKLITVVTDDTDRRMQRIKITGKGGIISKSLFTAQKHFGDKLLEGITPEENFILRCILDKISKNLINNP